MPGICGIWERTRSSDPPSRLRRMLGCMQQHTWYRTESHADSEAGLALGRVTLGFVNRPPQPATLAGGRWVAVMDGELYDPARMGRHLRHAGCEVDESAHAQLLLHGYCRFGAAFLRDLHGSFVACIWDADQRKLTLLNDRFGSRPLYYAVGPDRMVFSSSLRSLLTDQSVPREPDPGGLAQFFTFGHYLREETSILGVRVLPAAAVAVSDVETGHCRIERYWTPGINGQPDHGGAAERLEQIDAAFVRAVERCVTDTPNLGLSLSGGLDARSILAVMDHDRVSVRSVCLGMPGSLDHQCSERLAGLVGCPHRNYVLGTGFLGDFRRHLENMVALTDGQYLSQCIVMPTLPLYRELGIEVLLRGHVGELMHMRKAYNYSLDAAAMAIRTDAELEQWLFGRLQAYMLDGVDEPLFRGDLQRQMAGLAREALRQDLHDVRHIDPPLQRIWALFLSQRLRRETVLSLVKFRSIVEPRLPYLDNELVDLLLATPPELKFGETIQAYILRKRRPSFLKVVNANTGARVGSGKLVQRLASVKMKVLAKLGVPGYQPYERLGLWLRRELAPTVREILLGDECLSGSVFDADGVRHVVTQHLENRRNHTFLLLAMMIYELGRRQLAGG